MQVGQSFKKYSFKNIINEKVIEGNIAIYSDMMHNYSNTLKFQ